MNKHNAYVIGYDDEADEYYVAECGKGIELDSQDAGVIAAYMDLRETAQGILKRYYDEHLANIPVNREPFSDLVANSLHLLAAPTHRNALMDRLAKRIDRK